MGLNNIKINNTTNVKTGVVYDISKATGQSYETLADALSGNNVPSEVREGGMTVCFVHTSNSKYYQYRLMLSEFTAAQFTNSANWQGVDDEPTAGSKNLVASGGVQKFLTGFTVSDVTLTKNEDNTYRLIDGGKASNSVFALSAPIHLNKGETISVKEDNIMTLSNVAFLSLVKSDGTFINLIFAGGEPNARKEYFAYEECYIEVCNGKNSNGTLQGTPYIIKSYLADGIADVNTDCKTLSNTLSTNISKIYKTVMDSIPAWNGATSYKIGNVVKRNNTLYKCNTNYKNDNFIPQYWDETSVTELIEDVKTIANNNSGKLLGFTRQNSTLSVGHANSYRSTNGSIVSFSATYVSTPVHLSKGDVFAISTTSMTSSMSVLSLVDENGTYIKTLYNGGNGMVYYVAVEDCYIEITQFNGSTVSIILRSYIINYVIEELGKLYSSIANVESSLKGYIKDSFIPFQKSVLEHLSNPFIKTRIHLFGDSITHGMGSSDFSNTGELIPNMGTTRRNVGTKSWAAKFASQLTAHYNKDVEIPVKLSSSINLKDGGIYTYDGTYQLNNTNRSELLSFKFTGTHFAVSFDYNIYGGIVNVSIDGNDNDVDTYASTSSIQKVEFDGLENEEHNIKIIGTGRKNADAALNVIKIKTVTVPKTVEIINDGVTGHQSHATAGLVTLNSTTQDNFIIIMTGTNDRSTIGYASTMASYDGIYNWCKTNRPNAHLIFMSANPCGTPEYENPIYKCHIEDIDHAIQLVADKNKVPFISHYQNLIDYCGIKGVSPYTAISSDGVHPNDLGHKLMFTYLCKQLGVSIDTDW